MTFSSWLDRAKRMRGPLVAVASVGAVLSGLVGYYTTYRTVSDAATVVAAIPTIEADPSIAVLPLVNLSSDKEQDYFSDGVSEDLINLLTRVPKLRVIARTSSFAFKGKDVPIDAIARKLHVAAVLEGSVRRSASEVRVKLQLVRASDSSPLWSGSFDRPVADIFKVQDEIATAVVEQLKVAMLGGARQAKAIDPRVYSLVLRARALGFMNTPDTTKQAMALLREALAIAPKENQARRMLASMHMNEGATTPHDPAREYYAARALAYEAIALDPDYAPAYGILAQVAAAFDGDLAVAARHIERALALDPRAPSVLVTAASLLRQTGRQEEAFALARYLAANDPVNPGAYMQLAFSHRLARRWDEMITAIRMALELSPSAAERHYGISFALLGKGDAAAALEELQLEPSAVWRAIGLPAVYHALHRSAESDAALKELIAKYSVPGAYNIAEAFAYRGEADNAFAWLDRAVTSRDAGLTALPYASHFDPIRNDPRWLPFLRRIGRAPEQLAAIRFRVDVPQ